MKPRGYFSKYKCDDKIKIYSEAPMTNKQYRKMIASAKPRYMNDYFNTPKYNPRKDEKTFNNLLNSYYYDYSKLRNKYNFTDYEENYEEEEEHIDDFDFNEFQEKKRDLFGLFLSNDMSDISETNFDSTDNLIKNLYNGKNDTFLKNTQTKKDYELRLNDNIKEKKYKSPINVDYTEKESEKKEDKEDKEDNEEKEEKEENEEKEEEDNNLIPETGNDNEINNSPDKEEIDDQEINQIQDVIDENYLTLKSINNPNELQLFQDIIKYDNNNKDYQPPLYLTPNSITIEKEKEKEAQKQKEHLYDDQKQSNINKYDNGELKRFIDMIVDNKYPLFEQLINPYYQTDYVPQSCFPYPEEGQTDKDIKEKNENNKVKITDEDNEYEEFKFDEDQPKITNENKDDKKKPLVEDVIAPKYKEEYISQDDIPKPKGDENKRDNDSDEYGDFQSVTEAKDKNKDEEKQNNVEEKKEEEKKNTLIKEYQTPEFDKKIEQKKEENKNIDEIVGNIIEDNKQPVVDEKIKSDYTDKKVELKRATKLKESINNNEDKFESIGVEELNPDDDKDDDYGGFD
jgi:hypothetical protein